MIYAVSILLVISVILNLFLIKGILISIKKTEIYEEWFIRYQSELMETYLKLKEVDERQIFEKDDDVGFVFQSIVNIIEDLKSKTYAETSEKSDKETV